MNNSQSLTGNRTLTILMQRITHARPCLGKTMETRPYYVVQQITEFFSLLKAHRDANNFSARLALIYLNYDRISSGI